MRRLIALSTFAFILILGCSKESQLPSGFELLNREIAVKDTVLQPPEADGFYRTPVSTGFSSNLLLGADEGYQTRILLLFGSLPDSSVVESARLSLHAHHIGGTGPSFSATVHQVVADWEESEIIKWENFKDNFAANPIGESEIAPIDSDLVVFELNTALVTDWIDSTIVNQGILINCVDATFIKEFYSSEASDEGNIPGLELIYTRKDQRDTVIVGPTEDAFIVEYDTTESPQDGLLFVGNGIAHRSLLKFDISSIPDTATINRALLELTVDPENSRINEDQEILVGIFFITSATWDPEAISLDSSAYIPRGSVFLSSETFTITLHEDVKKFSQLIQRWTSGVYPNYGLLIRSLNEGSDVSKVAFYSSAADSARAPKLILDYTLPPS